jgi:cytochrome c oxidase subunit 2
MDMVPGMITYFWFTPTRAGTYEILCFELCGLGHPDMRGVVVVDEPGDYQAWLNSQPTFAQLASAGRRTKSAEAEIERTEIGVPSR